MATKNCPSCGNNVVYDQSEGMNAKCPVCHAQLVTDASFSNLVHFHCTTCGCQLQAEKSASVITCPVCDTVCNVQQEIKKAEVRDAAIPAVINYEGDNQTFVWKHPMTDFVTGSQLIVHESQEGIFFRNIVTYGHYEQDNNSGNGKEAIEWIVLKYDSASGKSLLLSRYGLDAHRFDASEYQGWDKSEMRSWLNRTFVNNAFTAKEQDGIVTTKVSTPGYSGYSGGSDTQDRLWLLSKDEATTYFGNDEARKAVPTNYAIAQGAYQSSSNKLNGTGCCWWWLRSPGYYSNRASRVNGDGSLFSGNYVHSRMVLFSQHSGLIWTLRTSINCSGAKRNGIF